MALSQAQKKFITLLGQDPKTAFNKIKNKEIDLNSFKNCFYKDGTSLLHTLVNGVITTADIHLPILTYVLENSILSLEDKAQGKQSAIEFYIEIQDHYLFNPKLPQGMPVVENLYSLIKANGNKNSLSSIYHTVCNLKKYGFDNEYDQLVIELKDKFYNAGNLLREIVIRDDVKALEEWFILNPKSKQYFLEQNFFRGDYKINETTQQFVSHIRNKEEKSNVLTFAIYKNSINISNYLIDNKLVPLSGTIENLPSYDLHNKTKTLSVTSLSQCVMNNNYSLYEKIFSIMGKEEVANLLIKIEPVLTQHPSTDLLDIILKHSNDKFKNLLLSHTEKIMLGATNKIDILYSIISSGASISTVGNTLNAFLTHVGVFKDRLNSPYTHFSNRFFSNICTRNNITDEEYSLISKCVKNLKNKGLLVYDLHMVFRPNFFENEKLFDCLVKGGLDLKNTANYLDNDSNSQNPINLLQIAVQLRTGKGAYQISEITNYNPNILKKIKNIIGDNSLINNNKETIIHSSIFSNQYDILDLYSNEEIKTLVENEKKFLPLSMNLTKKEQFENFIDKCINSGISFCEKFATETAYGILNHDPLFYTLLYHDVETTILDKILNKENKTIFEFSKDTNFWKHITSEEISHYIKKNGADYSNPEILLSLCMNQELNSIELYLQSGGNITYKDNDQDPLLHILVKKGYYKQANLLLEYYPDLNSIVNRQNKFAASYILEDLNKKCKDPSKSLSHASKNEFSSMIELTCNMFSNGFEQKNKKPVEFLKTQLEKYTDIFIYKPELKNMFQYGLLQNKIFNKQVDSSTKKKKI